MKTAAVAIRATLTDDFPPDCLLPPDPVKGAREMLVRLAADGYFVLIADPLLNTVGGIRAVIHWLTIHDLPYGDIYGGSGIPRADLYVNGLSEKTYAAAR